MSRTIIFVLILILMAAPITSAVCMISGDEDGYALFQKSKEGEERKSSESEEGKDEKSIEELVLPFHNDLLIVAKLRSKYALKSNMWYLIQSMDVITPPPEFKHS